MVVIQQHEHSLTLIDLNPKYPHDEQVYDDEKDLINHQAFQRPCDRCDQKITFFHRYYYKCNQCDYLLHKSCSELPITLEHASHPTHTLSLFRNESPQNCHVCKCNILKKQLCYNCSPCMLSICLNCGKNEAHHNTIYHPSHRHPLVPTNREILAMCDACGNEHKGVYYHCIICFLPFIHRDCVFSSKRLLIQDGTCDKFFHTHPLVLTFGFSKIDQQAKFYPRCRVCNKSFSDKENLWVYKCEKCRYYAHFGCAYLRSETSKSAASRITPERYEDDHGVLHLPLSDQNLEKVTDFFLKERNYESSITHNSHHHPLILVDAQCNDITTMTQNDALCNACLIPIMENMAFYKCKFIGQECNFVLHEWCTRLPPELKGHGYWYPYRHKYLQEHTLLLWTKAVTEFFVFTCGVCLRPCNGFAYSCVQCDYKIHVWCAFIPDKLIKHKSHPNHLLSSNDGYNRSGEDGYCRMCLSGFIDNNEISFSCGQCGFHLHLRCALLLPETIRHRYDKHPLSLAYSPVENHEGDYFCEVCEEELNPNAWFYHCHECVQSIHTTCAPLVPQSKACLYGGLKVLGRQIKKRGIYKPECHPHPLSFLFVEGRYGDCAKCGKGFYFECIFKCSECKFEIHARCLT
ncbi:putative chromatin regulator PHD family [Helianthus annuus]|nr:putative chromatin regulator PHD family [Helianthus annuus]KAJ0673886.1 putative chromatin regulator PHD family [Helianthus annuus]